MNCSDVVREFYMEQWKAHKRLVFNAKPFDVQRAAFEVN